ncbi:hypothetical protein [Mesobacillus jeotgali]|uniref:DUF4829 domain-containing protein n=1 Tax=Mesobacillus jeotgali TaxID=129985 RepID=A0ABY9VJB3_9BACI|nr:hypothetical protein [Mesobacillus jeotgali]WNF22690.1 hypothetical protein RH061_21455 [Mesobacillus jeotgali]
MYRKRFSPLKLYLVLFILVSFIVVLTTVLLRPDSNQALTTVKKFYRFEQTGNFSDSWDLFHPFMKQKFTKASFIQDRAHVFFGHFGAETFKYEISEPKEVKGWKAASDGKPFKTAYKFDVVQIYSGKYGKFSFIQEVYVVRYKDEWVILWDYNS